jgi:hypothetical protein
MRKRIKAVRTIIPYRPMRRAQRVSGPGRVRLAIDALSAVTGIIP